MFAFSFGGFLIALHSELGFGSCEWFELGDSR